MLFFVGFGFFCFYDWGLWVFWAFLFGFVLSVFLFVLGVFFFLFEFGHCAEVRHNLLIFKVFLYSYIFV